MLAEDDRGRRTEDRNDNKESAKKMMDKFAQKAGPGKLPALFLYITNIARFRTIKQTLTVFFAF
jgi:hypothetical protein